MPRIFGIRRSGYDPAKGRAHPDNHDPTLEHVNARLANPITEGDRLEGIELDLLQRFALATIGEGPTKPGLYSAPDRARAVENLVEKALLEANSGPGVSWRPTLAGYERLIDAVRAEVGIAHLAMRKANTRVARARKASTIASAHVEARVTEATYRHIAAVRDLVVKARNLASPSRGEE